MGDYYYSVCIHTSSTDPTLFFSCQISETTLSHLETDLEDYTVNLSYWTRLFIIHIFTVFLIIVKSVDIRIFIDGI
jgi:hypothetical protein